MATVQLWLATLAYTADQAAWAWPWLVPAERLHLARLRRASDQWRYAVARAYVRHLLAGYLHCAPQDVPLVYGPYGKPGLASPQALHFNVSHAGAVLLAAVSPDRAVGVDVEMVDGQLDWLPLARRLWMPETLPPDRHAFYQYWCWHEALLKAAGVGWAGVESRLTWPLHRPGTGFTCVQADSAGQVQPWTLHTLDMPPGYAGAVAVQGTEVASVSLSRQSWPCCFYDTV